jgi:hypothetical protein
VLKKRYKSAVFVSRRLPRLTYRREARDFLRGDQKDFDQMIDEELQPKIGVLAVRYPGRKMAMFSSIFPRRAAAFQ